MTPVCPICGGELKQEELHIYENILYCSTGAISLGAVELRIIKALIRSVSLTTYQLADIIGTTTVNINSRMKQLNKKLRGMQWTMKNVAGRGPGGAMYVLTKREQERTDT